MRVISKALSTILFILWDAASAAAAVVIGLGLRYGLGNPALKPTYYESRLELITLYIIILLLCNAVFRCYNNVWRRSGIDEYIRQFLSVALATAILFVIDAVFQFIPAEILVIIAMLELIFVLAIRVSVRLIYWVRSRVRSIRMRKRMKRVLIFGAGEAGANLVRRLESHPEDNLLPACFIDDNAGMWGKKVCGLPVVGNREKLGQAIHDYGIGEVIMAIASANHDILKEVLAVCRRMNCPLKRFGTIDDVSEKSLSNAKISDLNLEDLLRRDSVKLNMKVVKGFIEGKTVLITGGAGSIGSEICRQVLSFGAKKIIVFDISENGLYTIDNELKEKFDHERFQVVLGSIRDRDRLREVFDKFSPEVVFHAAAHKHVPMMELNPREAIKNNVFGTMNLSREAMEHKVGKFILISTDKAVNPANIMGATKRICEIIIQIFDTFSATNFAAVRFGNVLGSSGSVVPHFKKQIERGGPVTVTHPDMRRYFMTIPEAVQLVLEAGAMASGGEIFVLDMGEPVLIYDLACDLIRLAGFEPDRDIRIEFTGLRPGEKLFEEISLADEDVTKTPNNKIYICKPIEYDRGLVEQTLKNLKAAAGTGNLESIFGYVKELVPTFRDGNAKGSIKS